MSAELLTAMAYIVASGELSDSNRARVTDIARDVLAQRDVLTGPEYGMAFLIGAIDLAVSLADPALVAQVETIAQDPREAGSWGIEEVTFMMGYARLVLNQGLQR